MALQALYVAIPLLVFATTVISQEPTVCDLSKKDPSVIPINNLDEGFWLRVANINIKNPLSKNCTWVVKQPIVNSAITFLHSILDDKDLLTIDYIGEKNATVNIFTANGSIPAGILPILNPGIIITLMIADKPTVESRVFSAVFQNANQIVTYDSAGALAFPLSKAKDTSKLTKYSFVLQPSDSHVEWQLVLSFDKQPKNYSLKLDGQSFSSSAPLPKFYLPKKREVTFEIDDGWSRTPENVLRFSYWQVVTDCSKSVDISPGNLSIAVLLPDEGKRKDRQLATVYCTTLFNKLGPKDRPFQLAFDPALIPTNMLVNPGDQLEIVALEESLPVTDVFTGKNSLKGSEYFYHSDQLLITYSSFYAADNKGNFKAPTVSIPLQGGDLTPLETGRGYLTIIKMAQETKVVFIARVKDIVNRIYISLMDMQSKSLTSLPAGAIVRVYNSEVGEPLFTFGAPLLAIPSVVPIDTGYIRVEFEKNDVKTKWDDFQLAIKSIKPTEFNCYSSSVWAATFELNETVSNSECTWYIPETVGDAGAYALSPNVVKLPKGVALEVTAFTDKGPVAQSWFKGPMNKVYLPDVILQAGWAYQFRVKSPVGEPTAVGLELTKRRNYLKAKSEVNQMEAKFMSPNYPGHYPVNVEQVWGFNSSTVNTLLTWNDIDLAKEHKVNIIANGITQSYSGTADLKATPDVLVNSTFFLSLNSSSFNGDNLIISGRGFSVNLTYYSCGAPIMLEKGVASFALKFNASEVNPAVSRCLWTVEDRTGKTFGERFLRFNVSLPENLKETGATLRIYDSISLRPELIHEANGSIIDKAGSFNTSIKSAIIVYDFSKALTTKKNASIWFSVKSEECSPKNNYSIHKCLTSDRCIVDWMACNSINECGDWSDELYCNNSGPLPTPININNGVNGWVVVLILMPLGSILGILGYVYIPILMRRMRQGRYSEFRSDFSDVN